MRGGKMSSSWTLCVIVCLMISSSSLADLASHRYKVGEEVPVMMNTVSPFSNPSQTFEYYEKIGICPPTEQQAKIETLGEVLKGDRLTKSNFRIKFREELNNEALCDQTFTTEQMTSLQEAVENNYYYEMFIDDLPVWGFIGATNEREKEQLLHFLFTEFFFTIEYNGDQIVAVNVNSSNLAVLTPGGNFFPFNFAFAYSVIWVENTKVEFHDRMEAYIKQSDLAEELKIHWFSIIASLGNILILTGFLSLILLRILKMDFLRYSALENTSGDEVTNENEFGWKMVQGDVFRFPSHPAVFSAILGIGSQFVVTLAGVVLLGGIGLYYPGNRGTVAASVIFLYAITSVISGFVSAYYFKMFGGRSFIKNLSLTATLFPGPVFVIWSILNSVAWISQSTQALPFGTIMVVILIWAFFGIPLTFLGGGLGFRYSRDYDPPARVRPIIRPIPKQPWFNLFANQVLIAGICPFGAIAVEFHFILRAIWGHQIFVLFGILIISFLILMVVTSFICATMTYFLLSSEDHRWWWRSIWLGSSGAIFLFFYSVYFFVYFSRLSGAFQATFFFGYILITCYAYFFALGSVGYFSSAVFVRYIYSSIKHD